MYTVLRILFADSPATIAYTNTFFLPHLQYAVHVVKVSVSARDLSHALATAILSSGSTSDKAGIQVHMYHQHHLVVVRHNE